MTENYRAVVLGATGAVGSALVAELLNSPACEAVTILTRRQADSFSSLKGASRLQQRVVDLADLESETAALAECEAAFCTLGVGQPRKVAAEEFWKVDVEYTAAFARGAKRAGARHISLLSSVGADAASSNRYLRVKGEAEKGVTAAGISRTSLFRPSLLVTPEIRYGMQDRLSRLFFPLVAPLLPGRFHPIRIEDLARAMRINSERPSSGGVEILQYSEFLALLASTVSPLQH